uniref:Immunoglobulin V-set domain-containing protein n=1 Tax=Paramormyrops kingsleyae TaxID=1676925 RepID=A0A3B3SSS4_9TELE
MKRVISFVYRLLLAWDMLLAVSLALISISLSPVTGELIKVIGLSGGMAVIQCPYDGYYGTNQKYLCKGEVFKYCSDVIKNNLDEIFIEDQRFKLYDDRNRNVFTVTISSLSEEDAGAYWCGVDIYTLHPPTTNHLLANHSHWDPPCPCGPSQGEWQRRGSHPW